MIPPELLTIEKLKILDFSRNKLRVLPPQFNQYATSLKKLDLSHNEITRLPGSLCSFIYLSFSSCRSLVHASSVTTWLEFWCVCGIDRCTSFTPLFPSPNEYNKIKMFCVKQYYRLLWAIQAVEDTGYLT